VNKEELQKKVGQRIVQLRTQKNWSQADLARACNKDRQSIERIENGKVAPSLYSLYEISQALEISLAKILSL
jgi:putative transcriptional regulator